MWGKIYDFLDVLWGYPMLILLVGGGLYYGFRTGFYQIRCLPLIFRKTFGEVFRKDKNVDSLEGTLTPFQALSTVLAGTVGAGNIAGVASAIAVGGPGALFWMWVTAIFGMMTKLAEVSLSIKYRKKGEDGEYYGGPMHYIRNGLGKNWRWLAAVFSVAMILLTLTDAAFVQVNTAAEAINTSFHVPNYVTGIVIAVVSLLVAISGTKGIGRFCSVVVPPMCVIYIAACLVTIAVHFQNVGSAFAMVFKYAFTPMGAVGGFTGSAVMLTMTKGGARGIFSNEAGEGTAATVHATAKTDHPIHQGFYGVVEVFIDTIVICTLTGIALLSCGSDLWTFVGEDGELLQGVALTFEAFRRTFGNVGVGVMGVCVFLFTYSSYLGFFVEFRTSLEYVFHEKVTRYLKWIFFAIPLISSWMEVSMIWDMADMVVGFIFIPNMVALLLLSPQVFDMLKEYTAICKAEKKK